ncbi:MAG: HAD hydrolase-like protein [Clostridia bacterium]|nr:HAD hydrolase-like protein [Clostridia bacterium]
MSCTLAQYEKKKDFLVCVDSDGCAMDTMDIKHFRCFGPCMVAEWGLEAWAEPILARWNDINLYTMTRGINRFKGLAIALSEIDAQYCPIEDLPALLDWAEHSPELSNDALERAIAAQPGSVSLKKALAWSRAVNASITALPQEETLPFPMAREALAFAHERADVAIVSSANPGAVLEEWERHGLIEHTDIVLAQDAGSKAYCIGELMKKGYEPSHILMCGDAPGDLDAAKKNGVLYYPILVRSEKASWEEFISTAFDRLLSGSYAGEYQEEKTAAFRRNLGA